MVTLFPFYGAFFTAPKRILRTKDTYSGNVAHPEIEDILRETLLVIAKNQFGWDAFTLATTQSSKPIVDVISSAAKKEFSKYKLAKAFVQWSRDHNLDELTSQEIKQAGDLIAKINKALV